MGLLGAGGNGIAKLLGRERSLLDNLGLFEIRA